MSHPESSPAVIPERRLDVMTGVYRGLPPTLQEAGYYGVDKVPHVHGAQLTILDRDGNPDHAPGEVEVFVAHGFRGPNNEWQLADGRGVEDTIAEYNNAHPDKPVQFAAVCNPTDASRRMKHVGHAAGSNVNVTGFLDGGQAYLSVKLVNPDEGVWYIPSGESTKMVMH